MEQNTTNSDKVLVYSNIAKGLLVLLKIIPYSWKISRAPIFKDFEVFSSTSKILSSNFVKSQEQI